VAEYIRRKRNQSCHGGIADCDEVALPFCGLKEKHQLVVIEKLQGQAGRVFQVERKR
jgi:hypothetical protein